MGSDLYNTVEPVGKVGTRDTQSNNPSWIPIWHRFPDNNSGFETPCAIRTEIKGTRFFQPRRIQSTEYKILRFEILCGTLTDVQCKQFVDLQVKGCSNFAKFFQGFK